MIEQQKSAFFKQNKVELYNSARCQYLSYNDSKIKNTNSRRSMDYDMYNLSKSNYDKESHSLSKVKYCYDKSDSTIHYQKPINSGENLYMKGLIKKDLSHQDCEYLKKELNLRSSERCTFRPNISKTSKDRNVISNFKDKEFLSNILKKQDKKKDLLTKKLENQAKKECTFQPKINKISREIAKNRSSIDHNIFDNLHSLSKEKDLSNREVKRNLNSSYDFRPNLYPTPLEILNKIPSGDHLERGKLHEIRKREKLRSVEIYKEEVLRKSFRPKIGRAPLDRNRSAEVDVHEHLYNYSKVYGNN